VVLCKVLVTEYTDQLINEPTHCSHPEVRQLDSSNDIAVMHSVVKVPSVVEEGAADDN